MTNFITIEGIDNAGKTTLASKLTHRFGHVETTTEPTPSKLGQTVRDAIETDGPDFKDFFFFLGDRAYNIEEIIKPAMKNGKTVICDRYIDSTYAYQSHRLFPTDPVYGMNYIEDVMDPWVLEPDMTIYLDIPVDESLNRASVSDKYEKRSNIKQVRENYEWLQSRKSRFHAFDGTRDREELADWVENLIRTEL